MSAPAAVVVVAVAVDVAAGDRVESSVECPGACSVRPDEGAHERRLREGGEGPGQVGALGTECLLGPVEQPQERRARGGTVGGRERLAGLLRLGVVAREVVERPASRRLPLRLLAPPGRGRVAGSDLLEPAPRRRRGGRGERRGRAGPGHAGAHPRQHQVVGGGAGQAVAAELVGGGYAGAVGHGVDQPLHLGRTDPRALGQHAAVLVHPVLDPREAVGVEELLEDVVALLGGGLEERLELALRQHRDLLELGGAACPTGRRRAADLGRPGAERGARSVRVDLGQGGARLLGEHALAAPLGAGPLR